MIEKFIIYVVITTTMFTTPPRDRSGCPKISVQFYQDSDTLIYSPVEKAIADGVIKYLKEDQLRLSRKYEHETGWDEFGCLRPYETFTIDTIWVEKANINPKIENNGTQNEGGSGHDRRNREQRR